MVGKKFLCYDSTEQDTALYIEIRTVIIRYFDSTMLKSVESVRKVLFAFIIIRLVEMAEGHETKLRMLTVQIHYSKPQGP